jgi:hypothetical protein
MSDVLSIKGKNGRVFAKELDEYPRLGEDNQPVWEDLDPNKFYVIRYLYDNKPGKQYKEVNFGIKPGPIVEAVPLVFRKGPISYDSNPYLRHPQGKYSVRPIRFSLKDEIDRSIIIEFFEIIHDKEENNYKEIRKIFDRVVLGKVRSRSRSRSRSPIGSTTRKRRKNVIQK